MKASGSFKLFSVKQFGFHNTDDSAESVPRVAL